MKTEEKNPRMLAKIYRDKDIQKVQEMYDLGKNNANSKIKDLEQFIRED